MQKRILYTFLSLFFISQAWSQSIHIAGPAGSTQFGKTVSVLANGNYVITDPNYAEGGNVNTGAVYLYNGSNHTLISTLKGSAANNYVGLGGVTVLPNGNYVVLSPQWDNGIDSDVGAVTWCNGTTGIEGVISISNSLTGSTMSDFVGNNGITVLTNGNYVIRSFSWDNGAVTNTGAVTWANGATGITGLVSSLNSLVGSTTSDQVGNPAVTALPNGHYVVRSINWDNGAATNAGAVTWGNGNTGISGVLNAGNSLVGSTGGDNVGTSNITVLGNGNYIVSTTSWDNGGISNLGAVTWCNGTTGRVGAISSTNSLVGSSFSDQVGNVTTLTNNNYVIFAPNWDNGAIADAGAVTWANGNTGITGTISSANSLVGTTASSRIGSPGITALSNGNYVVKSQLWNNGALTGAGAVTFGNGSTGITGTISSSNSLIGTSANDLVGSTVAPLTNGGYVVGSHNWDKAGIINAGAVTWSGPSGITGPVTITNSLTGNNTDDRVGSFGIAPLSNGNFIVSSPFWRNGAAVNAGASTFGDGGTGITGTISSSNSLVGSQPNDMIGNSPIIFLSNGNYVVRSNNWANVLSANAGAVTFGNSTTGVTGVISSSNSLIGTSANDYVGSNGVVPLPNGNYVVISTNWDNGPAQNAGAVTWASGTTGITGAVSATNSLTGAGANDFVGSEGVIPMTDGNYVTGSMSWSNGAATDAGAVTWADGTTGIIGSVTSSNSLIGSRSSEGVGNGITPFANGRYSTFSVVWDNGEIIDAGAISFGTGAFVGPITSCNSVPGTTASAGGTLQPVYNNTYDYLIVGRPSDKIVTIFKPSTMVLAETLDTASVNITAGSAMPLVVNHQCRIIAGLTANGATPANGTIDAKVWIESAVPAQGGDAFVARHFEINPLTNPLTATANLVLYFTQQEFTDFNNDPNSALDLPANPSDVIGISNLRIARYAGTTNDNSGMPLSYSSTAEIIDPADTDIIWNASLSRWELSFNTTGFGGFFVQTKADALPLQLLQFNALLQGNDAAITWRTSNEINTLSFDVERSIDGRSFTKAGTVSAFNTPGDHNYSFIDRGVANLPVDRLFYRLRQTDRDNRYAHSEIVLLHLSENNSMSVYPNPAADHITISFNDKNLLQTNAVLVNMEGKIISKFLLTSPQQKLDLKGIAIGMYILKFANGKNIKVMVGGA